MQDKEQCCRIPTRLSGAEQAQGGSQLLAAIIRPGPAKIDVCENLALCKGRVPSISLQVLCGSGCLKSRKFWEKHRKTFFFIRFSLKKSERDQKWRQETPKVRKWSKSEPKGAKKWAKGSKNMSQREPKGAKREPKVSQRATKMHLKIDLRKRSRKGSRKAHRITEKWHHFGSHFPSKNDEKINAKIDA